MGVFTDNMQALNRGFVSERAEKKALQKKKTTIKTICIILFTTVFIEKKERIRKIPLHICNSSKLCKKL